MHRIALYIGLILLTYSSVGAQSDDKVLITVGDIPVTVGEFKYIYEKNNGDAADYSKESIDEYLDLYKKFKLKVKEAKVQRIDTISALKEELKGYRRQLATSYLEDNNVTEYLIKQAYNNMKQDVEVKHIFIAKPKKITPAATENINKKIRTIQDAFDSGKSWSEVVSTFSDDKYSSDKDGSLGFMTAVLPNGFYDFENAIYNLEVGEVSDVIESKMGYHIVKVESRRPARGKVKVAQILVKSDVKGSIENAKNKTKIDSISKSLKEGADWNKAVLMNSDDDNTKGKNGVMEEFGIGVFNKTFEDVAFGLKENGEISEPFETNLGYHILRRVEKKKTPKYEEFKTLYKEKIKRMDRYDLARENMLIDIQEKASMVVREDVLELYSKELNDDFYSYAWKADADMQDATILQLGQNRYGIVEFAEYIESNTRLRAQLGKGFPLDQAVNQLFEEFKEMKTLDYAEEDLEATQPAFKSLMREYNEGVLLFEITKQNVWDKASVDTVGLEKFYQKNSDDYVWLERATLEEYTISRGNESKAREIAKFASKNDSEKVLAKFNTEKDKVVKVQISKVEKGHDKLADVKFKVGSSTPIKTNSKSRVVKFAQITDIEPSRKKTIDEARGYIIADYQEELEKKWIKELASRYDIKVNKRVLKSLIK